MGCRTVVDGSRYSEVHKRVVSAPGKDVRHISGVRLLDNHQVNFVSATLTCLLSAALVGPLLFS